MMGICLVLPLSEADIGERVESEDGERGEPVWVVVVPLSLVC